MGQDLIWLVIKLALTLSYFVGFALIALFILHFKPTRKLIRKILGNDFEIF